MSRFETMPLPDKATAVAPDGSALRVLLQLERGSMIHLELEGGATSQAVMHRRVEELWYVLSGRAEMWRRQGTHCETVALGAGDSLSIPVGTAFQFRCLGDEPFRAVAVTMPPWPGEDEAIPTEGAW